MTLRFLTLSTLALVSGCGITAPTDSPPETGVAAMNAFPSGAGFGDQSPAPDWWRTLKDPLLPTLIAEAMTANNDLRIAGANLRAARAQLAAAGGARLPDVTASASLDRSRAANAAQGNTADRAPVTTPASAGFGLSWEIDLFGRIERQIAAASAGADAAEALRADTARVIAADVALAYVDLREAQTRRSVADRNLARLREATSLVETLAEAGRAGEADVVSAKALELATAATVPTYLATQRAALNRLTTLLAVAPGALDARLGTARDIPAMPRFVAAGDPASLLRRRPDIRAAEADLAAASARVGVTTADLFPTVTFGASLGASALRASDLSAASAQRGGFGPSISWNILNRRETYARIAAAEAGAEAGLARYQQVVMAALEETDTALSDYSRQGQRLALLVQGADASQRAADLARIQYEAGSVDFLTVLDAERTSLSAVDATALARADQARALIGVYRALAGSSSPAT